MNNAMSNFQLYIAIGLPVIAVLTSLVISLFQISGVRDDMRQIRNDFTGRFDSMERKIDGRFDSVERRLEMVQGDLHNMDIRLTKLEK